MKNILKIAICAILGIAVVSCRTDEMVIPTQYDILPITPNAQSNPVGLYLLNEGNMGSNKSTIDYVDYKNGLFARNLYAERNPTVIKELGDVGNDLQIYGNKLYAVINCSHKVEVMDAHTLVRIGQIDIPNCRFIQFHEGNAYVTAYVGPIAMDPNAQLGAVYRVDTTSLAITARCSVGYQPNELAIKDGYIYVANSGGYRAPNYDTTLSVVELSTMRQIEKITVAPNLQAVRCDAYGRLWVSSSGNKADLPPRLFVLEHKQDGSAQMVVTDTLDITCSDMAIHGDSLYFFGLQWSDMEQKNIVSYGIIDLRTKKLVTRHFITDGSELAIEKPYGIAIDPSNGDIYITDAKNYVSSGMLHCYTSQGVKKWSVRTGDIPAHMAFLFREE